MLRYASADNTSSPVVHQWTVTDWHGADLLPAFLSDPEKVYLDLVHVDGLGHRVAAAGIAAEVREILSTLSGGETRLAGQGEPT